MRTLRPACVLAAVWLLMPGIAMAQLSDTDRLAEQWRESKRKDLLAERARVDAQLAALDKGATPDTFASAAQPAPVVTPAAETPKAKEAGPANLPAPTPAVATQTLAEAIVSEQEARATQKFGGIEFGVGISFTKDLGSRDRVSQASLVNGIVRVNDEDNGRARIMLESHYFFTPRGSLFSLRNDRRDADGNQKRKEWGVGPFLALQPGTNNIIEAIGGGSMFGFRRDAQTTESFNIGLGLVVDPNTRVLGDDILANRALPVGETEIRYQETMQTGFLALVSFSF